jgi:hypothetical protein
MAEGNRSFPEHFGATLRPWFFLNGEFSMRCARRTFHIPRSLDEEGYDHHHREGCVHMGMGISDPYIDNRCIDKYQSGESFLYLLSPGGPVGERVPWVVNGPSLWYGVHVSSKSGKLNEGANLEVYES